MSWRNTDRAFGSRARGLRGLDGLGASHGWTAQLAHHPVGVHGLEGFVPPGSVPVQRWRNTDRSYGNRPKGLPFSGVGLGQTGADSIGTDIGTMVGTDIAGNPTLMNLPPPDFGTGTPATWPQTAANIGQTAFSDAFKVLQLFNPVPPGTVMQTGPGGSFISRVPAGATVPSSLSFGGGGMSLGLLLLLGVGAVVLLSRGH